jgi:hypothetical protein
LAEESIIWRPGTRGGFHVGYTPTLQEEVTKAVDGLLKSK